MPYRPADFSGLMRDYTAMYETRMKHDLYNRQIDQEDAQAAMDGLNYMEGLYLDFQSQPENQGLSRNEIDQKFAEKYPSLVGTARDYFDKYAAGEWAKHGETDNDSPIEMVQSAIEKGKVMLLGKKNGQTVPKTVNGSSDPKDEVVQMTPLDILRNTRYNIALKYGINPVGATQLTTASQGVDLYGQDSVGTQLQNQAAALGSPTNSTALPAGSAAGSPNYPNTPPPGMVTIQPTTGAMDASGQLGSLSQGDPAMTDPNFVDQASQEMTEQKAAPLGEPVTQSPAPASADSAQPASTTVTQGYMKPVDPTLAGKTYNRVGVAGTGAPDETTFTAPQGQYAMDGALSDAAKAAIHQTTVAPVPEGARTPAGTGTGRGTTAGAPSSPAQVQQAWDQQINTQREKIARNQQAGEQFAAEGDEVEAARYGNAVQRQQTQLRHMESAKKRGLSQDEFETEQNLIRAVDGGLIKGVPKPSDTPAAGGEGGEGGEGGTEAGGGGGDGGDPDVKVDMAKAAQGEKINIEESAKLAATSGGNRQQIAQDAKAGATAVGHSGVMRTLMMESLFPGDTVSPFTGTGVPIKSPAKRMVYMTYAMQAGYIPKTTEGLNAMNTYIQTGRLPEDVKAHFDNLRTFAAATASVADAEYKAAQTSATYTKAVADQRKYELEIRKLEEELKQYVGIDLTQKQADLTGTNLTNQGLFIDNLSKEETLLQDRIKTLNDKIDVLQKEATAQSETATALSENASTQQENLGSARNQKEERRNNLYDELQKSWDTGDYEAWLSTDTFDDYAGIDKEQAKREVLRWVNNNEDKVVQALLLADPNNPNIQQLANKVIKGQPLEPKDFEDAMIHSSIGQDAVLSILMGHAMISQDLNGPTNLSTLLTQGKDADFASGMIDEILGADQTAYENMLEIAFSRGQINRDKAEAVYKALQYVLSAENMDMKRALEEARKNQKVANES